MTNRRNAFTLIELLIVVAIIAILAAIAVPNFLEAQTRAKVSRSKNDLRALHNAMQMNLVDRGSGALLADFWDDDHPDACARAERIFGLPVIHNDRGGAAGVLAPLTTPIAYLSSVPVDVFTAQGYFATDLIENDLLEPYTYLYMDNDPNIDEQDSDATMEIEEGDYMLISAGPDRALERNSPALSLYDPTNGTVSDGNVILHSRTMFESYAR